MLKLWTVWKACKRQSLDVCVYRKKIVEMWAQSISSHAGTRIRAFFLFSIYQWLTGVLTCSRIDMHREELLRSYWLTYVYSQHFSLTILARLVSDWITYISQFSTVPSHKGGNTAYLPVFAFESSHGSNREAVSSNLQIFCRPGKVASPGIFSVDEATRPWLRKAVVACMLPIPVRCCTRRSSSTSTIDDKDESLF